MFESSLVESSGRLKSKSGRFMWVTATFNIAVVAVLMLVPLLYPEALPRTALSAMLIAPPPPPAALPPARPVPVKAVRLVAALDPFTAPTRVPAKVDTAPDHAPPVTGAGVMGMVAAADGNRGIAAAMNLGAPPAPLVKVAPPRAVVPPHISSGVVAGNKLAGSSPVYPPIAKAAHVSGAVVLHAVISRAGTIQSLTVLSGPEMLRANAISAVQDWKYRPYLLNGEPTEVDTTITVNFSFGV